MMCNWACDRDLLPANPCDRIRPPVRGVERDRILSDAEIAKLWNASFCLGAPYGQMYRVLFLTGQRRSEVSTIQWADLSGGLWTIPREKVKKDRAHAVPLSATAQAAIRELPQSAPQHFVFSTTDGERPSSNFSKVKRLLDAHAGVVGWTIHDIRRTVRSKLAELGVPREVARKVFNHEDGKVDRIYNRHEYLREKQQALELWEKHLLGLLDAGDSG